MDQTKGNLHKNDCGKYEIEDHEFSSGSPIQVYHQESGHWLIGRVEHAAKLSGYYFHSDYPGIPSFPLWEGMRVRVGSPVDHVTIPMLFRIVDNMKYNLVEVLPAKNMRPECWKEAAEEAYERLGRFLREIEELPYFDGTED